MDLTLLPILLLANISSLTPLHIRAALTGRPPWADVCLFCLGMQTPLRSSTLNDGEYPACAALTTGFVFRVENQATIWYLQRTGRTGSLTTLTVLSENARDGIKGFRLGGTLLVYLPFLPLLLLCIYLIFTPRRSTLLLTLVLLLTSRVLAIVTLRQQTAPSWHGAPEPGVLGDLLVLLSEDRWIRLKGPVDDLKAVTSGSWLIKATPFQSWLDWVGRALPYAAAIILVNADDRAKLALVACVLSTHGLVSWQNRACKQLVINGRTVRLMEGGDRVKRYKRRLDMADELIKETGRDDWAIKLGVVNAEHRDASKAEPRASQVVTM